MATRRTRKSSETEALRAKIRELEETLIQREKELMSKDQELQLIKNDQADHEEGHEVIDMLVFMNNQGLKHIADKILSYLDRLSFANCRLVSRSWRDYIDGEVPMLHLQIFHHKHFKPYLTDDGEYISRLVDCRPNFGPLFETMEKSTNSSDLLVFVNMCRQLQSSRYRRFTESPFEYLIDHHRHEELRLLLDSQMEMTSDIVVQLDESMYPDVIETDIPSSIFKYACLYGCVKCVKLFLERSEEKKIDLNYKTTKENHHCPQFTHIFGHCLPVTYHNIEDYPHRNNEGNEGNNILMLLLSSAEEKGIDINGTDEGGKTLKEKVEESLWWDVYPQYVLDVLGIDPSKIQK